MPIEESHAEKRGGGAREGGGMSGVIRGVGDVDNDTICVSRFPQQKYSSDISFGALYSVDSRRNELPGRATA